MVKKSLNEFIDEVINNIIFYKNNNETIKKLFLDEIDYNDENCALFSAKLDDIKVILRDDLAFFMESDPAVDTEEEVILAYPGYKAITYYRIAHLLYDMGYKVKARMISEEAHTNTGIDIHPGAKIGSPFFIDHGTGIVIGETSIIGMNVKIYQGVTLGALSLSQGSKMKGTKRHPTVGNNVTIYACASILGDITIGDNVTFGSNVFVTDDIPSNTKVTLAKPDLIFTQK